MGEFELLARVRERLPAGGARLWLGSGDDAAVTVAGGATATSVDAIVEGVHFRRGQATLAQIGRKALATALSDLAAMGAEPGEAYVVIGVPPDLDEDGCLELLDGMTAVASATGTTLAGGDVTRAPVLTLAVTVVGHAASPDEFVTRAGARPGDALALTGEIGGAAAGLLLLGDDNNPLMSRFPPDSGGKYDIVGSGAGLIRRQLEPWPRLEAGRRLAAAGATAMIDLSDGLGGDATRLAEASGVGLRIDAGALPLAPGIDEVARAARVGEITAEEVGAVGIGDSVLRLAVSGGEDYELLAAIPAERFDEAAAALAAIEPRGVALTRIGEVVAGGEVEVRLPGGGTLPAAGFDQLA